MGIDFLCQFTGDLLDGFCQPSLSVSRRVRHNIALGRGVFELADEFARLGGAGCMESAEAGMVTADESTHVFTRLAHDDMGAAFARSQLIDRVSLGRKHPGHGRIDGHAVIRPGAHASIVGAVPWPRNSY
jgi:hypothetical protein